LFVTAAVVACHVTATLNAPGSDAVTKFEEAAHESAQINKETLKTVETRVMDYVVDCGSEGYEGEIADHCVREKIRKDALLNGSKKVTMDPRLQAIEKNAQLIRQAKFSRTVSASRRAQRQFKQRHPDAVARLQRQEKEISQEHVKENRPVETLSADAQERYKPYLEQPEYAPRYSPDRIHRDVSSRSDVFLTRTGYPPRNAVEKKQIDMDELKPRSSPFPNNLEISASMKNMEKAVHHEEKKLQRHDKLRHLRMAYELDKEVRKLSGKPERPHPLSNTDRDLISGELKDVMWHVSSIAKRAIHEVTDLDGPQPLPDGVSQKLTVTANNIARKVTRKLVNSTTAAIRAVRTARESAQDVQEVASAAQDASLEAKQIIAEGRKLASAEARRIHERTKVLSSWSRRAGSGPGSGSGLDVQRIVEAELVQLGKNMSEAINATLHTSESTTEQATRTQAIPLLDSKEHDYVELSAANLQDTTASHLT